MLSGSITVTAWVGYAHNTKHGCGSLGEGCRKDSGGILLLGSKPGHVGKSECIPAKLSSK